MEILLYNTEPEFLNVKGAQDWPGIDFANLYSLWQAGSSNRVAVMARQAANQFFGSLTETVF